MNLVVTGVHGYTEVTTEGAVVISNYINEKVMVLDSYTCFPIGLKVKSKSIIAVITKNTNLRFRVGLKIKPLV